MENADTTTEMLVTIINTPGRNRRVGRAETIPRWSPMSRLALGFWTFSMPAIAALMGLVSMLVPPEVPPVLLAAVYGFLITHCLIAMFYVAFAGQNPRLHSRVGWQLAIVLAGPITIPVYWFMHVWDAPKVGRMDVDEDVPGYDMFEAHALGAAA